mmetsp:Transcript_31139/g.81425  ORF Transcript_31139/g.81425 Transcript_31139/m.81425 type:complete len:87 (-) Transcript_31139:82-342(-)
MRSRSSEAPSPFVPVFGKGFEQHANDLQWRCMVDRKRQRLGQAGRRGIGSDNGLHNRNEPLLRLDRRPTAGISRGPIEFANRHQQR